MSKTFFSAINELVSEDVLIRWCVAEHVDYSPAPGGTSRKSASLFLEVAIFKASEAMAVLGFCAHCSFVPSYIPHYYCTRVLAACLPTDRQDLPQLQYLQCFSCTCWRAGHACMTYAMHVFAWTHLTPPSHECMHAKLLALCCKRDSQLGVSEAYMQCI